MRYKKYNSELYGLIIYATEYFFKGKRRWDNSLNHFLVKHRVFKDVNVLKEYFSKDGWIFDGNYAVLTDSRGKKYAMIISIKYNDEEM
jgi:hypothetical protein